MSTPKLLVEKEYFGDLIKKTLLGRKNGEHFFFSLTGETSQFVRINGARVRQLGVVEDCSLEITLQIENASHELREAKTTCTLTGLLWKDQEEISQTISQLRKEVPELPINPFAQAPQDFGSSESSTRGSLLDFDHAVESLLPANVTKLDLSGIYASGPVVRAMANSAGQMLWFSTETFTFDYSIYTASQRALKGTLSGKDWDAEKYAREMNAASERLSILEQTPKRVERGSYRTFLSSACVDELVTMISWGALSESSIRQGESCFRLLRSGERSLSPLLSLREDFRGGLVPRFNSQGEISQEVMPLIEKGKLQNAMISARTAKEYSIKSNGAAIHESPRSACIEAGALSESEVLKSLGQGLYLSNLHYLGWSDQPGGRITGMTRYACFWVENGKIVAPIENMRFDDSLFSLLGSELEALTSNTHYNASVSSYDGRDLGGTTTPGALLRQMTFTI